MKLFPLTTRHDVCNGQFFFRPNIEGGKKKKPFPTIGSANLIHGRLSNVTLYVEIGFEGELPCRDNADLSREESEDLHNKVMVDVARYLEICFGSDWLVENIDLSTMAGGTWDIIEDYSPMTDSKHGFKSYYLREALFPPMEPTPI